MLSWIESNLSDEQKAPLQSIALEISILAAAGSGKTRTLTYALLQEIARGVPPENIIAFTFTEKAASELFLRISQLVNEHLPGTDISGMSIGTIHSWCFNFLLEQPHYYGYTPLDDLHLYTLASRFYSELNLEKVYGKRYPFAIEDFLRDIEVYYNENISDPNIPHAIKEPVQTFCKLLNDNRMLTFGGMIRNSIDHLQKNGPIADLHSLYVDEYQDVNPAQVELIRCMRTEQTKLVVVGDDLQSIYNWRGSDVSRIIDFSTDFPKSDVYELSTNYRSYQNIIDVSNTVAGKISYRAKATGMVPRRPDSIESVHWISTDDEYSEAKSIAELITNFHSHSLPFNQFAILVRSVKNSGKIINDTLLSEGIPVNCPMLNRGGQFIDDFILPVFQWLGKKHDPPRNGDEEAEMEDYANTHWDLVSSWLRKNSTENDYWLRLNEWSDLILSSDQKAYSVRDQLYDFLDFFGISLSSSDKDVIVGLSISSQIIRSVEEIHRRRISGYKSTSGINLYSEIAYALRSQKESFGESTDINLDHEGVVLTTVHQSKGLEWPVVFLPRLNRGLFPLRSRKYGSSYDEATELRYSTKLDDERRLFYVACTRAMQRLILMNSGMSDDATNSIFIKDLSENSTIVPTSINNIGRSIFQCDLKNVVDHRHYLISLGVSDLLMQMECPFQYALRRISNIQPAVGDELGYGQALHEIIQRRIESTDQWTEDDFKAIVSERVFLPLMSEQTEKRSKSAILTRLLTMNDIGLFAEKSESEIDVELIVADCLVHGIVDGLIEDSSGEFKIRDWKANIHTQYMTRYSRQLQFYALAAKAKGYKINKAELIDIGASTKARKMISVDVNIDKKNISTFEKNISETIVEIRNGNCNANPGTEQCSICDMNRVCGERKGEFT